MIETNNSNDMQAEREASLHARTTSVETSRSFDRPFARISWGAIFAGAIIALATQLVLTLIGAAIGLVTLHNIAKFRAQNRATNLSVGFVLHEYNG